MYPCDEVISRDGQQVKAYGSMTGPQDKGFVSEVEKLLAAKDSR